MKNLGIIGGVGPPGTWKIYQDIMHVVHAEQWTVRPEVTIVSVKLPIAVEKALLEGGDIRPLIPILQDAARKLRDLGVDIIILACNTLHALENEILEALRGSGITFLSLRDVVPAFLERNQLRRVGLLGTSTTIETVFVDRLRERGIEQVNLPDALQKELNRTIQRIVTAQDDETDTACIQKAVAFLENAGVQAIGSACTDLTGRIRSTLVSIFDTEQILVQETCAELRAD